MAKKYIAVPRTLSQAVLRAVTGPLDSSLLVPPDQLQAPLLDPKVLFEKIDIRPIPEEEVTEPSLPTQFKEPNELFGEKAIAPSGMGLASPESLNLNSDSSPS